MAVLRVALRAKRSVLCVESPMLPVDFTGLLEAWGSLKCRSTAWRQEEQDTTAVRQTHSESKNSYFVCKCICTASCFPVVSASCSNANLEAGTLKNSKSICWISSIHPSPSAAEFTSEQTLEFSLCWSKQGEISFSRLQRWLLRHRLVPQADAKPVLTHCSPLLAVRIFNVSIEGCCIKPGQPTSCKTSMQLRMLGNVVCTTPNWSSEKEACTR